MGPLLSLPESGLDKKSGSMRTEQLQLLERTVTNLLQPALDERSRWKVGWLIADAYLQGVRSIGGLDFETGLITVDDFDDPDEWVQDDSQVPFRWEESLNQLQVEIGRLMQLDISPRVQKRSLTLQSLAGASLSQALLDYVLPYGRTLECHAEVCTHLPIYGTVGLNHVEEDVIGTAFGYGTELVPCWELVGIPGEMRSRTELRGIGRTMLYPIKQLQNIPGVVLPDNDEMLDLVSLPQGAEISKISEIVSSQGGGAGSFRDIFDYAQRHYDMKSAKSSEINKPPTDQELFTPLRQVYCVGPQWTLDRWIVMAGRACVLDFWPGKVGEKIPMPISIAQYQNIGHFFGRSFLSKLIPAALRLERLLHRLVTNTDDFDRFGILAIPGGMGFDLEAFKDTGSPRIATYDADPMARREPIQQISPVNSDRRPGEVASMFSSGLGTLAMQGPMYSGASQGRMDSGVAYSTVAQLGSTHLFATANDLDIMWSQHYRSILHSIGRKISEGRGQDEIVNLVRVDNTMMGLSLTEGGQLNLKSAKLPDPWILDISIRSKDPISKNREREEALLMLQNNLLHPMEFIILNYKNNWGFPIGQQSVWNTYCKVVLQNIILFNDGITPTDITYAPGLYDKPEVALLAIEDFVSQMEFSLAHKDVQDKFGTRYMAYKMAAGTGVLPPGAPTIDMAAQMSAARPNQQLQGEPAPMPMPF